jgi:hypothetical protein
MDPIDFLVNFALPRFVCPSLGCLMSSTPESSQPQDLKQPLVDAIAELSHVGGIEERGAVFTRREVVEFILDLVGYTSNKDLRSKKATRACIRKWRLFGQGCVFFSKGAPNEGAQLFNPIFGLSDFRTSSAATNGRSAAYKIIRFNQRKVTMARSPFSSAMIIASAVGSLILLNSLTIAMAAPGAAKSESESLTATAKDLIRQQLRDPGSAQFRNVVVHHPESAKLPVVCGEVNRKNGLGCYAGRAVFL